MLAELIFDFTLEPLRMRSIPRTSLLALMTLTIAHADAPGTNVLATAEGTTAAIVDATGAKTPAPRLNDGDVSGESIVSVQGLPAILLFELPRPALVSAVRLFTGNADYADNPSGDVSAAAYRVEGLTTASGVWRELVHCDPAPAFKASGARDNASFVQTHDFPPLELSALRVTILASHDTGRRADPAATPPVATLIREVELYSPDAAPSSRQALSAVLQAEFRLPVYRSQQRAQLVAVLDKRLRKGLQIQVSFRERHTGAIPRPPPIARLKPGQNTISVDISNWPNGEYRTELRAAESRAGIGGQFARLLRLDRLPPTAPPTGFVPVTGRRLFFPDAHYLARISNLTFRGNPGRIYNASRAYLTPGKPIQIGNGIGFDAAGNLVVSFVELNRNWESATATARYTTAHPSDLSQWTIHEGAAPELVSTPSPLQAAALPSRSSATIHDSFGGGLKFRFYDPAQDGPVNLQELMVQYVGYQAVDWGLVKPPPQSTWVLWHKGDEYLLLHRTPLLLDNISGDEFEHPTDSNDNHAGQYLSANGKTFYFVRGRLLKRYPPFIARYDNLWQVARVLTVFSTQNGVDWTQHYYGLPDENDPPTAQHYGADLYAVPEGNGLKIGYAYPYVARDQQYNVEMHYSWDGAVWQRSAHRAALVPVGKPGDFNFGNANLHNNIVERDGLVYHLIGWASAGPHFAGEFDAEQASAEFLEQRYAGRDLEKWPYWPHFGSYEALAGFLRKAGSTPGVLVYRQNGWFSVEADNREGAFLTLPLTATGALTANVIIAPGGVVDIRLTDLDGKPLPGFHKRLTAVDGVAVPIFSALPSGPFRVEARMKATRLFTLNF